MKFPWQRKPSEIEQAKEAEKQAVEDWPKVKDVSERARRLKAQNGFAAAIVKAMGGHPT